MPKIDTYTATTTPVVPDQPFRFMETGQNPVAGLEQQSKLVGHQLGHIAGNILAQQDSVDFGLASSNYAAAPKQIALDTAADPEVIENPMLYEQKFNERLQEYQRKLIEETPNDRIHGAIQTMFEQRNPEIQYEARRQGLKLAADDNIAKLNVMADVNAKAGAQAITAGNPQESIRLANDYSKSVMDAVINQHMTKEEGQKRILAFESKRAENEMLIYANGPSASRDKLYALSRSGYFDNVDTRTHSAIMNHAFAVDAAEQARLQSTAQKNAQDDERNFWGWAKTGEMTEDLLDAIEKNLTSVDPKVGHAIRRYMEAGEASKKVKDPQISIISQDWAGLPRTLEKIVGESNAIQEHVRVNGTSDSALARLDKLAAEWRAERNTQAAQADKAINKATKTGDEVVKSTRPPVFGSARTQRFQRGVEQQIQSELRLRNQDPRNDRSPEGIEKWVIQRRKELDPRGASGKDLRTIEQQSSDAFAEEER